MIYIILKRIFDKHKITTSVGRKKNERSHNSLHKMSCFFNNSNSFVVSLYRFLSVPVFFFFHILFNDTSRAGGGGGEKYIIKQGT